MPVIKSAKKKLRQDKKRTLQRAKQEASLKDSVKAAKAKTTADTVRLATQAADKAAKHHIIHANKAARIKSTLAKLLGGKGPKTAPVATKTASKKVVKKSAAKKKK